MNWFHKTKLKTVSCNDCASSCACTPKENVTEDTAATVKILGGGCAKCNQLEANTREALGRLGMDLTIEHVKDHIKIAAYGVMATPALVYHEKVLCSGRVLSPDEIVLLLRQK